MHGHSLDTGPSAHAGPRQATTACDPEPRPTDPTLQDPNCVFQILTRHFERYTPEMVSEVCGCTQEEFERVAELLCANSGPEHTTAICYALGWTQHTTGVQMIRAAGILQLLLGNMGRPGGGIMAMRGHSTIQGSTDVSTLYDSLPGYLPQPCADERHERLDTYVEDEGQVTGGWSRFRQYIVSLLKAWYGDAATPANDFGFGWLPRPDADYSQLPYFDRMAKGGVKGYFLFGQNPAGGGPNARLHRAGLRNLDWLVVVDWFEIESAVFWRDDPEGPPASENKTEVFFLPAASSPEKEGSLTNTQRMLQWHDKALDPMGDSRSDAWYLYHLGKRLKQLYAGSTDPRDQPLLNLTWDYEREHPEQLPDGTPSRITDEPDLEKVLMEINGYCTDELDPRTGRPRLVSGYDELTDDGSTACGCWIYSGVYPEPGRNRARERKLGPNPLQPDWGWAWPANRRTLYNRASADPDGQPWSERKAYVWWDDDQQRWTGHDVPDFEVAKPPSYRPHDDAVGPAALRGDDPFIMQADGKGWLFASSGLLDGPLPSHYEPQESPVANPLYRQQANPTREVFRRTDNPSNPSGQEPGWEVFPYVFTTYRLTEHHTAGGMSRWQPYLAELQPEFFCEVSTELAREAGLENGGWATIVTARTAIEARVLVTDRVSPLNVAGRTVHQIGLPYHWGVGGDAVVSGDSANDLFGVTLDPNVHIQESKAATCDIRPGRRGRR